MSGCIIFSMPLPNIDLYNSAPIIVVPDWSDKHLVSSIVQSVIDDNDFMIDMQQQLALHHNLSAAAESASRRRLGHLPQVTSANVMDYVASGACSTELPLLENYDVTDFTIVMWTRGKNHMIQLLHSYDAVNGLSKGVFARYAIEFTTPSVTWTLDLESGQDSDLRLNGGASVKEDQLKRRVDHGRKRNRNKVNRLKLIEMFSATRL